MRPTKDVARPVWSNAFSTIDRRVGPERTLTPAHRFADIKVILDADTKEKGHICSMASKLWPVFFGKPRDTSSSAPRIDKGVPRPGKRAAEALGFGVEISLWQLLGRNRVPLQGTESAFLQKRRKAVQQGMILRSADEVAEFANRAIGDIMETDERLKNEKQFLEAKTYKHLAHCYLEGTVLAAEVRHLQNCSDASRGCLLPAAEVSDPHKQGKVIRKMTQTAPSTEAEERSLGFGGCSCEGPWESCAISFSLMPPFVLICCLLFLFASGLMAWKRPLSHCMSFPGSVTANVPDKLSSTRSSCSHRRLIFGTSRTSSGCRTTACLQPANPKPLNPKQIQIPESIPATNAKRTPSSP